MKNIFNSVATLSIITTAVSAALAADTAFINHLMPALSGGTHPLNDAATFLFDPALKTAVATVPVSAASAFYLGGRRTASILSKVGGVSVLATGGSVLMMLGAMGTGIATGLIKGSMIAPDIGRLASAVVHETIKGVFGSLPSTLTLGGLFLARNIEIAPITDDDRLAMLAANTSLMALNQSNMALATANNAVIISAPVTCDMPVSCDPGPSCNFS